MEAGNANFGSRGRRLPSDADIDGALRERALIIASNRGPVTFHRENDGSFSARKGSGGVVTAVSSIAREHQPIWIAAAMTEGDRLRARVAQEHGETLIEYGDPTEFRLRYVAADPAAYHQYYNVISNPLLWFLQHYLWDTPRSPDITHEIWDAWRNGYVAVNRLFADEILAARSTCDAEPIIMLQDYHLYLCPPSSGSGNQTRSFSNSCTFPGQIQITGDCCRWKCAARFAKGC